MPGVTKEQIRQAREADLFDYLERHERGVLKRDGPSYRHKEHDSLVYVTAKNYWYWNSRGKRINALDYLMEIRGYGLVDAVNALARPAMQYSFPSRYYQDYAAARQASLSPDALVFHEGNYINLWNSVSPANPKMLDLVGHQKLI